MLLCMPNPIEAFIYVLNSPILWKFKMAAKKSEKSLKCHIFLDIYDKHTN